MTTAEKLATIAENQQRVYDAGYAKGKAEGGSTDDYYDMFWDVFQNGGAATPYPYAFCLDHFDDETYNPKYDIVCSSGSSTAQQMFYKNTKITDTKVPIDARLATDLNRTFESASALVTIRSLLVKASNAFSNTFAGCTALQNITFAEGSVIGQNINLSYSPLTKESILSVLSALSSTATGKTATFKKTAVEAAFTTDEWNALVATKPNWTIAKA